MRRVRFAVPGVVAAVATLGLVFLWGMRAKSPPVVDAVRRTNRRVFNPRQLRSAGTEGAFASVRRSQTSRPGVVVPVMAHSRPDAPRWHLPPVAPAGGAGASTHPGALARRVIR